MDDKQRNNLIKNIQRGLWSLSEDDETRLIAALRAATTDEHVDAVKNELNQIDPPVAW